MRCNARKLQVMISCLAFLATACFNPVEHEIVGEGRVVKLRVSDNAIVGSVGGISDGRSLCSTGSIEFLVASGAGILYRFNSPAMAVDTSFIIGFGSGSGYRDMILAAPSSVYLIGAAGKIIEVCLLSNSVVDEFEAGPMPTVLCASPTTGSFFAGDGSDRRIREINPAGNTVRRTSIPLDGIPVSLAVESFQNAHLLASTSTGCVETIILSNFFMVGIPLGHRGSDIAVAPFDSVWAVAHPVWSAENGIVSISSGFFNPEIFQLSVAGHPTDICGVPGPTLFYALSYLGNGTSRITAINYFTKEIIAEVDIPGFPWDITSHAGGEYILALTSDI